MIYLSQQDQRWSKDKIGASSLTVGRFGCCLTSIAMLSDYFGCYRTPKELAHDANHYTKDGLVIWQNFKFPKMSFVTREYGEHPNNIATACKDPKRAVMLQVSNGAHWVAVLRLPRLYELVAHKGDYLVLDPWTGTKVWAKSKYKNVTGAAYWGAK